MGNGFFRSLVLNPGGGGKYKLRIGLKWVNIVFVILITWMCEYATYCWCGTENLLHD